MKNPCIIILLLFYACLSFSQDTVKKSSEKKHFYSLIAGCGYYGDFGGKKQTNPIHVLNALAESGQYRGFAKVPTLGVYAGGEWNYKISDKLRFSLSLLYYLRRDVFEGDYDTVLKYHAVVNYNSYYNMINNVIKYNYTYLNLELPLMMDYKIRKCNLRGGIHLPIITHYKTTYTYLLYPHPLTYPPYFLGSDHTTQKTITGFKMPLIVYPSLQISYALKVKKTLIRPFFGVDFYGISFKDFYFHVYTSPNLNIESHGIKTEKCFFLHGGIIYDIKKNKFTSVKEKITELTPS
jgi:hypothetical protein